MSSDRFFAAVSGNHLMTGSKRTDRQLTVVSTTLTCDLSGILLKVDKLLLIQDGRYMIVICSMQTI